MQEHKNEATGKLLPLLEHRFQQAKDFTKDFQSMVKKAVEDYEVKQSQEEISASIVNATTRYDIKVPYIFATHESFMASVFERLPAVIFKGRGSKDSEKKEIVEASYEYIMDKVDMESHLNTSIWWFILAGFMSIHVGYKVDVDTLPQINEETGEPIIDEESGKALEQSIYNYDDPILEDGDPEKEYYSPDSRFSIDTSNVPYYFRSMPMSREDIIDTFGEEYADKVKYDMEVTSDGGKLDTNLESEINRASVKLYHGRLPDSVKDDPIFKKNKITFDRKKDYYVAFAGGCIMAVEEMNLGKSARIARWYGIPNKFFGFGIGKTLAPFQKELSLRRSQQLRYADHYAFPKVAVPNDVEVDDAGITDPRSGKVIKYDSKGKAPEYLVPPSQPEGVAVAEAKAREDAQFISGLLDLAKGQQDTNTVDTATGQQIFAEAAEKKVTRAKKLIGEWYRSVVILLLKNAQANWNQEKIVSITDNEGNEKDVVLSRDGLKDINFDTDIDIDIESVSINKDVLRQQAIALYEKTKDDPMVDRKKVFRKLLRDGFNENDADGYIKESDLTPGMKLMGEDGSQYIVDESGSVVPMEDTQGLADSSGDSSGLPIDQASMAGGLNASVR